MADIIIFPGGNAPHRTALELERRGYQVNPRTGRVTRSNVQSLREALARVAVKARQQFPNGGPDSAA